MNFPNYSSLDFRHVYDDVSVIRHIYSLEIIQHLKRACSLEGSGCDKNTKRPKLSILALPSTIANIFHTPREERAVTNKLDNLMLFSQRL